MVSTPSEPWSVLIVARVQTSVDDRMNSTGLTTLFNTSGAALGPLLASFVLLPTVGFQWSLLLSAASYTLLAIFVSERGNWSFKRPLGVATSALLAAFIFIIAFFPYRRDQVHFGHANLPYVMDGRGNLIAHLVKKVEGTSDVDRFLSQASVPMHPGTSRPATALAQPTCWGSPAVQRFVGSPIIDRIWPPTLNKPLHSYFIVREARYLSHVTGSNGLAELDLYPACAFRFWRFWAATNSDSPLQKQLCATQKYRRRKQCWTW